MREARMGRCTAGFGLSLVVTSLLNALILVAKELNGDLMNAFKSATGHHWVTHGAIVIGMFIVLGLIFSAANAGERFDHGRMLKYIVLAVVISGIVVAGFFLPHLRAAG